jgi:3-hydroxyisobutyrate dehydrogenase
MARIAFIGLGNMGTPMFKNLIRANHSLVGYDVVPDAAKKILDAGGHPAKSIGEACGDAEIVISMLPSGEHVKDVYLGPNGVLVSSKPGTLLLDCSTIDIESARAVDAEASKRGFEMLDAPVSGGVGGAQAGTLTFMVGGSESAFAKAKPILEAMGKTIVHTGKSGNGQAAKVCNNMILGISMIAVSEAFVLAEKLGLDSQKLFDVASKSSGQCWALTTYCPVAGPVPTSPANREYQPGFTASMMLKDLNLAREAAKSNGVSNPLGTASAKLYDAYVTNGHSATDFSGIVNFLRSGAS